MRHLNHTYFNHELTKQTLDLYGLYKEDLIKATEAFSLLSSATLEMPGDHISEIVGNRTTIMFRMGCTK